MGFWLVAAGVVVVGFAVAWWSSGRAAGTTRPAPNASDAQARAHGDALRKHGTAGGGGGSGISPGGGGASAL
jgi:hypothetical protein